MTELPTFIDLTTDARPRPVTPFGRALHAFLDDLFVALPPLATSTGFHGLDDRWPDEAVVAAKPDRATAIVTLSHDIKIDDPALAAALRSPAGYIAALGSRRSHARRLERLAAMGFDEATLARIDGPAGIDIGGIGPAEIALSIAAGAVRAFSGQG